MSAIFGASWLILLAGILAGCLGAGWSTYDREGRFAIGFLRALEEVAIVLGLLTLIGGTWLAWQSLGL